jgi:hypothetical protein
MARQYEGRGMLEAGATFVVKLRRSRLVLKHATTVVCEWIRWEYVESNEVYREY